MIKLRSWPILAGVGSLLFIALSVFHWQNLETFPKPFVDESLTLKRVDELKSEGASGHFYKEIYNEISYKIENDSWLSTRLYSLGVKAFPQDPLLGVRGVSLTFGLLLILSCAFVAYSLGGTGLGGLSAALLSIPLIGLSEPFHVASHWARPDIMGVSLACVALAWSFHKDTKFWHGAFCGLLLAVAFELHIRACLIATIIPLTFLLRRGASAIFSKWFLSFSFFSILGAFYYYFFRIHSDESAVLSLIIKARLPNSELLNPTNFFEKTQHVIGFYLNYMGPLIWGFLSLPFLLVFKKTRTLYRHLIVIILSVVFLSTIIFDQLVHFRFVAASPVLDLALASAIGSH